MEKERTKLLVVDDDAAIADLVALYLKNEGYEVKTFSDPLMALNWAQNHTVDLAVLDVMMPGMDGFTWCGRIREEKTFPIIMLTAKDEDMDKITGLTLGADDYVTKPFKPLELVARVKAQLRRYKKYNQQEEADPEMLDIGGLSINKNTRICTMNGKVLNLTPTEFGILWVLCQKKGRVISSEDLFSQVWGDQYFSNSNNTIMVHIRHLREKMEDSAEKPKYIKTVWGVGYKIDE